MGSWPISCNVSAVSRCTWPSLPPTATTLPSGAKSADQICADKRRVCRASTRPVATSRSTTAPSNVPTNSVRPFGEKAMAWPS